MISQLLFTILAMLAILMLVFGAPPPRSRRVGKIRVRPFTAFERLALPCVTALSILSGSFHRQLGFNRIALANTLITPAGRSDTKLADGAISRRKLVCPGSDVDHVALCGASDIPLGSSGESSTTAAEERLSFRQFGLNCEEEEGTASGTVTVGEFVVPAASGALKTLPTAPGTYYICGRAKTTATTGNAFAYIPCFPIRAVVA
jgi:hypothetical protein